MITSIREIFRLLEENPYCIPLYVLLGLQYLLAGYPDLASGAAYKALLLADAVRDVADEYHEQACEALRRVIQQQPLVERISLLKGELHADMSIRQGRMSEPDEETDVEVDVWLREHYLLLTYVTSASMVQSGELIRFPQIPHSGTRPHHGELSSHSPRLRVKGTKVILSG